MLRGSVPSNAKSMHTFSRSPQASIQRSSFNRSFTHKTTFDAGLLIPVLVDEALPGDTFNLNMTAFCRMATPIFPIMDNLYLDTFFFSVPYRLVWDNWEKFNGYQVNPGDSTDYLIPQIDTVTDAIQTGDLADYMGIPVGVNGLKFNALHFRAYNLIWNEWFRDQNLQTSVDVETGDGPEGDDYYDLLPRGKRHDYFTSCLPFPQKGPAVELPIATSAPVIIDSTSTNNQLVRSASAGHALYGASVGGFNSDSSSRFRDTGTNFVLLDPNGTYVADLSSAAAVTINDLRLAFQTQKLYERDMRGGTRYTEVIKAHFGVTSPDMRLQRPEYLGGGTTPIIVNPIAQTSSTSGTNALGRLAAYGVCAPQGHGFTKSFTEHELIIGLVSVRADLTYQQGMERMWNRRTRLDYYWPALSHIGEQAVLNQEIYATGTSTDEDVFGYQERYAEYRYKNSLVTGLFRSNATTGTPLDSWHLAQDFADLPYLNSEFIVENPPMARILALTEQPNSQFLFDCAFNLKCARPMSVYSVPGLVDHF